MPFLGADDIIFDALNCYDFVDDKPVYLCFNSKSDIFSIKYITNFSDIVLNGLQLNCNQYIEVNRDEFEIVKREITEIKKMLSI